MTPFPQCVGKQSSGRGSAARAREERRKQKRASLRESSASLDAAVRIGIFIYRGESVGRLDESVPGEEEKGRGK